MMLEILSAVISLIGALSGVALGYYLNKRAMLEVFRRQLIVENYRDVYIKIYTLCESIRKAGHRFISSPENEENLASILRACKLIENLSPDERIVLIKRILNGLDNVCLTSILIKNAHKASDFPTIRKYVERLMKIAYTICQEIRNLVGVPE